jgi:hypothetical protein
MEDSIPIKDRNDIYYFAIAGCEDEEEYQTLCDIFLKRNEPMLWYIFLNVLRLQPKDWQDCKIVLSIAVLETLEEIRAKKIHLEQITWRNAYFWQCVKCRTQEMLWKESGTPGSWATQKRKLRKKKKVLQAPIAITEEEWRAASKHDPLPEQMLIQEEAMDRLLTLLSELSEEDREALFETWRTVKGGTKKSRSSWYKRRKEVQDFLYQTLTEEGYDVCDFL